MNVVGKVSSLIRQGMYSVATPFHPFGGAVDIIVVKQKDGSFKSTPWYVRFGKFQGVLKGAEKIVRIEVNGVEADFYMYLDNSGEAYFVSEDDGGEVDVEGSKPSDNLEGGSHPVSNDGDLGKNDNDRIEDDDFNNGEVEVRDERLTLGMDRLDRTESSGHIFYDFQDELSSLEFPEYDSSPYDDLDCADHGLGTEDSNSEVVLVSVDGHILMAPISSSERNDEHAQESMPLFHLGHEDSNKEEITSSSDCFNSVDKSHHNDNTGSVHEEKSSENLLSDHQLETSEGDDVHSCVAELVRDSTDKDESLCIDTSTERKCTGLKREEVFQSCLKFSELAQQSVDKDEGNKGPEAIEDPPKNSPGSFLRNDETGAEDHETLRIENELSSHDSGSLPELHAGAATGDRNDTGVDMLGSNSLRIRFDSSVRVIEQSCGSSSSEEVFVDSVSVSPSKQVVISPSVSATTTESPRMQIVRTNVPTSDQIASLNLKEGQNIVNFIFSTRVLGTQKVEAHIYVWKWNTRIVISDVDGTITKSDVLGQFMPLFGRDWTHSGIARLFSAVKENGYQLLFLSARAIVQAYLTKSFLFNLKQDGKSLPIGPVVISPDGLFPSLYREVIRRAPHEFKIACLEDIKALFPQDYNPFYAGFGNRDTDELSYRKIGIPKGKIFIINPKGEVAINHRIDVKSYTSLHTLVNDMFPPTSLVEQEDYNSWNYWKMPLPDIDGL